MKGAFDVDRPCEAPEARAKRTLDERHPSRERHGVSSRADSKWSSAAITRLRPRDRDLIPDAAAPSRYAAYGESEEKSWRVASPTEMSRSSRARSRPVMDDLDLSHGRTEFIGWRFELEDMRSPDTGQDARGDREDATPPEPTQPAAPGAAARRGGRPAHPP